MPPTKIDSQNSKTAKTEADLNPEAAMGGTRGGRLQVEITLSVADVEKTITKLTIALP